jgi:hypothetical protein
MGAYHWRPDGVRLAESRNQTKEVSPVTAFIVGVFEGDIDAWKERFLSDPLGRKQVAKGHTLLRSADNPNQVFVRLEFADIEGAKAFAEKVRGSNVLDGLTVTVPPTAAELLDKAEY